jgi:hypothetical protein
MGDALSGRLDPRADRWRWAGEGRCERSPFGEEADAVAATRACSGPPGKVARCAQLRLQPPEARGPGACEGASWLLGPGICRIGGRCKVVQDMLGHSSIVLTADTYTSVLPEGGTQGRRGHRRPHHHGGLPGPGHSAPPPDAEFPAARPRRPDQRPQPRPPGPTDRPPAPPGDRRPTPWHNHLMAVPGRLALLAGHLGETAPNVKTTHIKTAPIPWPTSAHTRSPARGSGAA